MVDGPDAVSSSGFHISGFVFRRALALAYCAAFLSLIAQADGLFGCDGAFPPKAGHLLARLPYDIPPSIALVAVSLLGAFLAGAALLAAVPCERNATVTFASLWALFACCAGLAPALYPALEDKLLLEAGLVGLLLVGREGRRIFGIHGIGRRLMAWLLFRAIFISGAEKVTGPCGAWRSLTALGDAYQLEVFPLPPVWLLWMAPRALVKALSCLQLYTELILSPLVLAAQRSVVTAAAIVQLGAVLIGAMLGNRGYAGICLSAMALALLDDSWHGAIWSEQLLCSWGCWVLEEEDGTSEDKNDAESEDESPAEKDAKAEESVKAMAEEVASAGPHTSARSGNSTCWVLVMFVAGYAACLAAVLQPTSGVGSGEGPLSFLVVESHGTMLASAIALGASALAISGLTTDARRAAVAGMVGLGLGAVGVSLWLAGLLQLSMDLGTLLALPVPMKAVAKMLDSIHVAHALSVRVSGKALPCPHLGGRADIVLQGAMDPTLLGRAGSNVVWLDLSSRFLPITDDRRPVWLQPYTPRLDLELWRWAQLPGPEVPRWAKRLASAICLRHGASARLSAGPWQGPAAALHDSAKSDYAKLTPPLLAVRAIWRRRSMTSDVHSNKWWNTTDGNVLKLFEKDELFKIAKRSKPKCAVAPEFLQDVPLAEALIALLAASLLLKILVQGAKR